MFWNNRVKFPPIPFENSWALFCPFYSAIRLRFVFHFFHVLDHKLEQSTNIVPVLGLLVHTDFLPSVHQILGRVGVMEGHSILPLESLHRGFWRLKTCLPAYAFSCTSWSVFESTLSSSVVHGHGTGSFSTQCARQRYQRQRYQDPLQSVNNVPV